MAAIYRLPFSIQNFDSPLFMLQVGLEVLLDDEKILATGERFGYLSNQASTTRDLVHGRVALQKKYGKQLTCLFSPQHGFYSEKQDNMIESDHMVDDVTGLVVHSLYGEHRRPTAQMFAELDLLIIDLVDVGSRIYTFLYTMAYCLEAAAEFNKKVIVLDRPNPLGGVKTEGNILRDDCRSFVGLYPLPMRHGLTFAELALLINSEYEIGAELQVVPLKGWERTMIFTQTGFPWVAPSPNMPTPATALLYPGQVIWEGTNVSEGRGTTLPFQLVGAPFWQHEDIICQLNNVTLPGCFFRPLYFQPTSGKWAGSVCCGFQIHVLDPQLFLPYRTGLTLLQSVYLLYPESFQYIDPPYEYEFIRTPIDLIVGDRGLRKKLENGVDVLELEQGWEGDLAYFNELRQKYFLY